MPRKLGMNKHQKAAHRRGEPQVSKQDVPRLIELSLSDDADDRLVAAQYLCPCHVRTCIPAVWEALYRSWRTPSRAYAGQLGTRLRTVAAPMIPRSTRSSNGRLTLKPINRRSALCDTWPAVVKTARQYF